MTTTGTKQALAKPETGKEIPQQAPKEEGPTIMERVGGAFDGALIQATGGPFGLLLDPTSPMGLKGHQNPPAPFHTYGYIFSADDDTPSPGDTPGAKKGPTGGRNT